MEMRERIPMQPGAYEFYALDLEKGKTEEGIYHRQSGRTERIPIEVTRLLSDRGATCLVYEGFLETNGRRVILKEFYPSSTRNTWGISRSEREDQKLHIPSMVWNTGGERQTEISARLNQFMRSYEWQKKFHQDPRFLEVVVEPQYFAVYGDTFYIISDYHNGESLRDKADSFNTLRDKVLLFQYITDVMSVLEENKYLFLDVCEENFLVIQQTRSHYQLRLFDMDSVIDLSNLDQLHQAEGNVFYHKEYAADEIFTFEKALRRSSFDDVKKDYLEESMAVYSLGILFFKILFGHIPNSKERKIRAHEQELAERLVREYDISFETAHKLLTILSNMIAEQSERYVSSFYSCENVLRILNEFSDEMNYEKYISQRETAKANATFAAYHMLQKFPLFRYADLQRERKLKVALIGENPMRTAFLSALISIGQMLDTRLEISILAEDAEEFWQDYVSEDKNSALKRAVHVEVNGRKVTQKTDPQLVKEPLAYLRILTGTVEESIARRAREDGYRYFVILDSEEKVLRAYDVIDANIRASDIGKVFVGCLQTGKRLSLLDSGRKKLDLHFICGYRSSEGYNEKMYGEQIYKMGLMAHAYYHKCLDGKMENQAFERLEQTYQSDIYSRMSSERAALHGIYKMASVGIDIRRPGRFRAYFEKLQDAETVERLGWLEHVSWTASMLTAGYIPVDAAELDSYAYHGINDWKDKSNPEKIRHPLLAASLPRRMLPEENWQELTEEQLLSLDPLDQVSYALFQWYRKQVPALRKRFSAEFERNAAWIPEDGGEVFEQLRQCGLACMEHVGEKQVWQDMTFVHDWKTAYEKAEDYLKSPKKPEGGRMKNFIDTLAKIMEPVLDSYKNRDYKQLDRDIVYSVLDMTIV